MVFTETSLLFELVFPASDSIYVRNMANSPVNLTQHRAENKTHTTTTDARPLSLPGGFTAFHGSIVYVTRVLLFLESCVDKQRSARDVYSPAILYRNHSPSYLSPTSIIPIRPSHAKVKGVVLSLSSQKELGLPHTPQSPWLSI